MLITRYQQELLKYGEQTHKPCNTVDLNSALTFLRHFGVM